MRLYIATLESEKKRGVRVKMAVHAPSKRAAREMALGRRKRWTLMNLSYSAGARCITFLDEFPDD
jgi:hypothetical protein